MTALASAISRAARRMAAVVRASFGRIRWITDMAPPVRNAAARAPPAPPPSPHPKRPPHTKRK